MKIFRNIKKSVNDYLERVAKENKETFGDGVPDCCKMNNQVNRSAGGSNRR